MENVKMFPVLVLLFILPSCISNEKSFFKRKYLNLERIKAVEKDEVSFQVSTGNNQLNCQSVTIDSTEESDLFVTRDQERNTSVGIVPELPLDDVNSTDDKQVLRSDTKRPHDFREKSIVLNQEPLNTETEKTDLEKNLRAQFIWFMIGLVLMVASFLLTNFGLAFFWVIGSLALIAFIISVIYAVRYFAEMADQPKGTKTGIGGVLSLLIFVGTLLVSKTLFIIGILIATFYSA